MHRSSSFPATPTLNPQWSGFGSATPQSESRFTFRQVPGESKQRRNDTYRSMGVDAKPLPAGELHRFQFPNKVDLGSGARWLVRTSGGSLNSSLFQQRPHHLRAESVRDVRVGEQAGGEFGFFLLKLVDALLDGVLAEEFVDEDGLVLADAVGAVGGLGFGGGIPPGVVVDDGVGGGEVEAGAAGLEGDEEERDFSGLEILDELAAVLGGSGEFEVGDFFPDADAPRSARAWW